MAQVYLVRNPDTVSLNPAYPSDRQHIIKMKHDPTIYLADIKQPRNPEFHKKFMALVNMTVRNLPEGFHILTPDGRHKIFIENVPALLDQLKILTGHVDWKFAIDGTMYYKPKSISFAAMDEPQFQEFTRLAIDKILANFLVGLDEHEVQQRMLEYL